MIAGLLLASGASRRFGGDKLAARLGDRPVVRWSAEALAGAVDDTFVVVAPDNAAVRDALAGLPVHVVENVVAHEGMASSIRAGVAALPADVESMVVTLGDQPLIDAGVIRRVVAAWRAAPSAHAVSARYADGRGHPVLFAAASFPALQALAGDRGARGLLASLGDRVVTIEVDGPAPADVDTPSDLEALARAVARGS